MFRLIYISLYWFWGHRIWMPEFNRSCTKKYQYILYISSGILFHLMQEQTVCTELMITLTAAHSIRRKKRNTFVDLSQNYSQLSLMRTKLKIDWSDWKCKWKHFSGHNNIWTQSSICECHFIKDSWQPKFGEMLNAILEDKPSSLVHNVSTHLHEKIKMEKLLNMNMYLSWCQNKCTFLLNTVEQWKLRYTVQELKKRLGGGGWGVRKTLLICYQLNKKNVLSFSGFH